MTKSVHWWSWSCDLHGWTGRVFFLTQIPKKAAQRHTKVNFCPYKQVSGRNAFIWCDLLWKLSKIMQRTEKEAFKLHSLFAAWPFWTYHTKSHNMKALVILSHSWSPFLPLTWKCEHNVVKLVFVYILLSKCQWVHLALAIKNLISSWNKIVMRSCYKIILVWYNKSWWKWRTMTN